MGNGRKKFWVFVAFESILVGKMVTDLVVDPSGDRMVAVLVGLGVLAVVTAAIWHQTGKKR